MNGGQYKVKIKLHDCENGNDIDEYGQFFHFNMRSMGHNCHLWYNTKETNGLKMFIVFLFMDIIKILYTKNNNHLITETLKEINQYHVSRTLSY